LTLIKHRKKARNVRLLEVVDFHEIMVCRGLRRFDGTFRACGVTMTDFASQCHSHITPLQQLLCLLAVAAVGLSCLLLLLFECTTMMDCRYADNEYLLRALLTCGFLTRTQTSSTGICFTLREHCTAITTA